PRQVLLEPKDIAGFRIHPYPSAHKAVEGDTHTVIFPGYVWRFEVFRSARFELYGFCRPPVDFSVLTEGERELVSFRRQEHDQRVFADRTRIHALGLVFGFWRSTIYQK